MWWKFSEYELIDGYIQPTRDAVMISYDPWEDFIVESSSNRGSRPYLSFLQVAGEIARQIHCGEEVKPEPLVRWVQKFGLIGLFWHDTVYLQEPFTIQREDAFEDVVARSWSRVGGRWQANGLKRANGGLSPSKKGVLVMNSIGGYEVHPEAKVVPCKTFLNEFFTKPPRDLSFQPSDPDCLRYYREPLEWLVESVYNRLGDAVDGSSGHLNYLLSASSDWVEPSRMKSHKRQTPAVITRSYASLLSYLGWMLVRDQADGQRILTCPCGKDYLSSRYQSRFCSDSCRSRFHKRTVRAEDKKTRTPKRANKPKQPKGRDGLQ